MQTNPMTNYREQIMETLDRLLQVQSEKGDPKPGMPFGEGPALALAVFLEEAQKLGFRTGESSGYAGWAEFGPENAPMIASVCHLDVVPAAGWPEAYTPEHVDGKIIARGSSDDKGPAVSVLYAMKSLMDSGVEPKTRIRLIVGTDEESGSACMKYYTANEELPLAAFTADADFPVINGEKGHMTFDLVWNIDLRSKNAPALWEAHCGRRGNVIPGEATLTFRDPDGTLTEVETIGKMGHAAKPDLAQNAIQYAMADAAEKCPKDAFVQAFTKVLGTAYDGSGLGIAGSDEPSGPLTLNVGILEYEDGIGRIKIDVRYPVTWDYDELRTIRDVTLSGSGFAVENETNSPPLYRPEDDPLVVVLMDAYREVTGRDDQPIRIGGGTYARSVPNTLAFGATFPGELELAHQKGEFITEDALLTAAEIYKVALLKMSEEYGK